MTKPIRKAVLPVAGLGTRFLPASKTTPKNLLNIFDRPILSYVVAEGRAAGIEHFIFVTGRGQGAIEDYFDHHIELETQLEAKGKADILADLNAELGKPGEMSFVRQMQPLGLGHAVWCARDLVGDEPFAVMLPDMLMDANPPALVQAVQAYEQVGGNIVVVEPAPEGQAHKYGVVALDRQGQAGRLARMTGMVEKPAPGTEPSNLFISGRYILQPEIFDLPRNDRRRRRDPAHRRHAAAVAEPGLPCAGVRRNHLRLWRQDRTAASQRRLRPRPPRPRPRRPRGDRGAAGQVSRSARRTTSIRDGRCS